VVIMGPVRTCVRRDDGWVFSETAWHMLCRYTIRGRVLSLPIIVPAVRRFIDRHEGVWGLEGGWGGIVVTFPRVACLFLWTLGSDRGLLKPDLGTMLR
jgi:hypothetical protein